MNRMKEVAKMLGVEMGEKFNIKGSNFNPHYIGDLGLYNNCDVECHYALSLLLTGEKAIEKARFKPFSGVYFYVDEEGHIQRTKWTNSIFDYYLYNAKNCFRTREEITHRDIERIIKEMKGDYHQ